VINILYVLLQSAKHSGTLTSSLVIANRSSSASCNIASSQIHTHTVQQVNVDLYCASMRSAFNALPLPVGRHWSLQASPIARHQHHTARPRIRAGWCITRCACLLFQLSSSTHFSLPQRAGSGWVGLGAWFCAEVLYPSKDGHPPRY